MSQGISAPFIRYPIGTSLMMAGILFVGLVAYPLLPVAPLPQVDFPTIQVTANLPGASPETMASSVAQPLERQFAQIPGIAQMTSTSYLGTAAVTIQFDLNRSIDGAANDVQGAINAASGQLPKNLPSPPTYRKVNPADFANPAVVGDLGNVAADHRERRRRRPACATDQPDFRRGAGHHRRPAKTVDPCPGRSGETGGQGPVAGGCPQPDRDHHGRQPEGQYRRPDTRLHDLRQRSAAGLQGLERRHHRLPQWRAAAIRDIGQAVTGPEDAKQAAWANGKRGVFLVVFKQPGANVIETVDKIKSLLPRLVAAIPPAIKIELISDRTQTIRAAVEDVQFTLMLTIALVVMVIFIFLRSFWATVIPAVTVPLALLGACALMWVFGYTLDNLSLMALTIAVGFVVDDAIVMLENITRYIEEGERTLAAAFKGAREIGFTIMSISISLIAVLIPLLLMGGIIGRLFREFAGDSGDDHLRIDGGIAVADADDGLALPARARRNKTRPLLSMERTRVRRDAPRL